jgi:hypothetical protein
MAKLRSKSRRVQRVANIEAPDRVILRSLKFNSDGTKLAAATEGNFMHIWDLKRLVNSAPILPLAFRARRTRVGHFGAFWTGV